jgi:hypothetical protein
MKKISRNKLIVKKEALTIMNAIIIGENTKFLSCLIYVFSVTYKELALIIFI